MAITDEGTSQSFSYTGDIQTFTVPFTGLYKLEVWGSNATSQSAYGTQGKGGYSVGYKKLNKGQTLYVVCGGRPYNGGGSRSGTNWTGDIVYAQYAYGGGATHIALVDGTLSSIGKTVFDEKGLIVAGGGGCSGYAYANGGNGGGASGGTGNDTMYGHGNVGGAGGTQTSGYAFGQGQDGYVLTNSNTDSGNGAIVGSGGGGYYGGYRGKDGYNGSTAFGAFGSAGGGGGSGWIGGVPEITFKGTTYSPSMSNGVNSDTGKATITLEKKGGFPIVYFDGTLLDGITFDGVEIDTIIFNGITLS